MTDHNLRELLQETCPVLPGQENRAWGQLQERRSRPTPPAWLRWQSVLASGAAVATLALVAVRLASPSVAPVSAASQSPGIFATAFYSQNAHAQVVWLNGMEPASDGPTYMDPTSKIDEHSPQRNDSL